MSDTPNIDRLIDYLRPLNPERNVLGMNVRQTLGDLLVMRERASAQWREAVREATNRPTRLIVTTEEFERMRQMVKE